MAIHVLTNEYKLLHAVTITFIPVALQHRILRHHLHEFFLRHCGIESACLLEVKLFACLLKEIAHIILLLKITHTLAADDSLVPMASDKLVKTIETKRLTTIIDKRGDTILIAMIVMMPMAAAMWIIALMIVIMVVIVMMIVIMVIMVMVVMVIVLFLHIGFHLLDPSSRGGYLIKLKEFGIKDLGERHIAIVAIYDLGFGLNSTNDSTDMFALLW